MNLLDEIAKYGTVLAPLGTAAFVAFNHSWIRNTFVPKLVLASENESLTYQLREARNTIAAKEAQAVGWHGAAEAAAFTKENADDLFRSVVELKTYIPKFKDALEHIRALDRVILEYQAYFAQHHIAAPIEVPSIPDSIREELQ